jgi:hypothetical protein
MSHVELKSPKTKTEGIQEENVLFHFHGTYDAISAAECVEDGTTMQNHMDCDCS